MSLRVRALVSLALLVGFYLLAIGVALFLIWVPYGSAVYINIISLKLDLFCLIFGPLILWSIIPRRDRFEPPGPRINLHEHPKLAAELEKVSASMHEAMPSEIYATAEINAGVMQRGGILGFGSRRVMILGLPLLRLLTVSEFRAVICHEFGHYYSGDTKLGPVVYRTRNTILRTVLTTHKTFLGFIFVAYANFFNRVTLSISRAQELVADRLAAQFAGSTALTTGLTRIHEIGPAWGAFVQTEVLPVVHAGFAPSLSEGFSQFVQVPATRDAIAKALATELNQGRSSEMDSHPPLRERLKMIEDMPSTDEEDTRSASELLESFQTLDLSLVLQRPGVNLQPIDWHEVLEKVYLPVWKKQAEWQREALQDLTASALAEDLKSGELTDRMRNPEGVWPTREQKVQMALNVAACAFALALHRDGWTFHFGPGSSYCERAGHTLEPFKLSPKLAKGEITLDQWREICEQTGITSLKFEPQSAAASP